MLAFLLIKALVTLCRFCVGPPLVERRTMFTSPAFTVAPSATKALVTSALGPKKSVVALVEFGAELELEEEEEEAVGEGPLPGEVVEVELLLSGLKYLRYTKRQN